MQTLENFGLTINESKVYLASLELGLARVTDISRKSGVIRETTYGIISNLSSKGFISSVIKSGVKYFEAAEPKKLRSMLKEKLTTIETTLPHLEALMKERTVKPKVGLYEGKEGLKTIMENLLTSKTEILTMVSNKNIKIMFELYFPHFVKKRVELKIPVRLLTDGKPLTKKLIRYKYLPKEYEFKTATWIYENKLALVSLSQTEPIGVVIEDKEIVNAQRNQFELIWSLLEKSEKMKRKRKFAEVIADIR